MYSLFGRYIWFLQMPMKISLQFILYIWQPYLLFYIYNHLCIPCLADIFLFPLFMPIKFEIIYTWIPISNTNAY